MAAIMILSPGALAVLVITWNLIGCTITDEESRFSDIADRIVAGIAFGLIVECLYMLSVPVLAWALVLPGIVALGALLCYRAFFAIREYWVCDTKKNYIDTD